MIRFYCIGFGILIVAIAANWMIGKLGVKSWYDFFALFEQQQLQQLRFLDYLWLFVFYPLCLALGAQAGSYCYQKLIHCI
jgi:hypothetical protein